MIVTSTVYSNGGHSIINLNRRRIGLLSANINNDDGPGGGSTFIDALLADDDGTTFTFTFCPEFVVVAVICVSTLAPIDASFIAVLQDWSEFVRQNGMENTESRLKYGILKTGLIEVMNFYIDM